MKTGYMDCEVQISGKGWIEEVHVCLAMEASPCLAQELIHISSEVYNGKLLILTGVN